MSRRIGQLAVSDVGLGCMGFSHAYGAATERREAVNTIRRAYDMGYTFFDTAECYTGAEADGRASYNEELVGEALQDVRDRVVIATKFGVQILPDKGLHCDSRPETIRRSVEGSLRRLGTDCIDLYYQHRLDAQAPAEEVADTVSELMREGKIRAWGISETTEEYLRRAHAVCPVAAVQNRYSMMARWHESLFPALEELGIAFVAFSPLANGLLSGKIETAFAPDDYRNRMPQYTPEGLEKCRELLDMLQALAEEKEATPAQVSMAWMLCRKPYIIPIPGSRKEARLQENFGAASVRLTAGEIEALDTRLQAMDFLVFGGNATKS